VSPTAALSCARERFPHTVAALAELISFPSVSAQPARAGDVAACAAWLADRLRRIGLADARVVATRGHPVVFASWRGSGERPTLLVYGHYDVQPAEPLGAWRSPPFAPAVRDGALYGRGASDDKGQLLAHVAAMEAYLRTGRELPVNVTCLFEGEEEIGSPSLNALLLEHRDAFAADAAVVSDMPMLGPRRPAITYAMRGSLGLGLEVRGPGIDLHSGTFGGAIANPLEALCAIVASLHERSGRVAVPGFYDAVRAVAPAERAEMARTGPTEAEILRNARASSGAGERGYTAYERTTIRPTLSVNGITGGYGGPGAKAVIPTHASAKLSCRLVADQEPEVLECLIRRHVAVATPPGVGVTVTRSMAARPALVGRDRPAMRAAARAYARGFGVAPVFLRNGGSVPVVNTFDELLGIPTVLMGFGLPDDAIHAPNERVQLPTFDRAIATCIWFFAELGALAARPRRERLATGAAAT
jgi:acetylornithine deacetylase/succinyl-diaminopimelate desuccinylase-like protein